MSITDIAATDPAPEPEPRRGSHPTGFEPVGITYTAQGRPESAVLASKAPIAAPEHRAKIEEQTRLPLPADVDVQVERLTIQNDAAGEPVQWWYKYRFVPRQRTESDIDALVKAAKSGASQRNKAADSVASERNAFIVALGDLQLGKGLASSVPILTTDGWVKHGDLRVGMCVYGRDGKPKRVLDVLPTTERDLYEVELGDGTVITCDEQHLWSGYRKYHTPDKRGWEKRPMVVSLPELKAITEQASARVRPFVLDAAEPIELPAQALPIDPYLFGLWLGDGKTHTGIIALGPEDRALIEPLGVHVPSDERDGRLCAIRVPGLTAKLRELGVLGGKRIPEQYLRGSVDQRLALLQGLMDTDGYASEVGACEFTNTNRQIIDSTLFLLASLGIRARTTEHVGRFNGETYKPYWRIQFRASVPVFRLPRKRDRQRESTARRDLYRSVRAVRYVGTGDAQCITVEGGLYLAGERLTVTHNCDGDGVEGTVARFLDTTKQAVARYKRIAKGTPVYLIHLGDCIEGMVSQGGANTWRTTITTTEQVRLYRRLLVEQVKAFASVAPSLVVCGIPGNHDEAHRPLHTYGDSWAIDAVSAVRDALDLAGGYDHVQVHAPARDELTLTLDICGTVVGMAHGHQWRAGKAVDWWAKQSHGRQPVGDADLLLSAHLHHLRIEHTGSDKTWMQVPALESGSQWWRHRTGEWGQPGVVTMLVGGGSWSALEVLT